MLVHLKWIIQKQWDRSDELAISICKTQQAKHKSIFSAIDIKRFWFWNTYKKLPFWYQGKWFIPMCYLPDSKFWSTCNTITFYFVRYCSGLHTISSDKLLLSGFCFSKKDENLLCMIVHIYSLKIYKIEGILVVSIVK